MRTAVLSPVAVPLAINSAHSSLLTLTTITMTFRPRPILKRDSPPPLSNDLPFTTTDYVLSPHVHFPPTPWITTVRFTHSPHTYDRAPIAISPNERLVPRRHRKVQSPPADFDGERRGRPRTRNGDDDDDDDDDDDSSDNEMDLKGSYFHPRAYEACTTEPCDVPRATFDISFPPSLTPDMSPSDESDDQVKTPPDAAIPSLPPSIAHPSNIHTPSKVASPRSRPTLRSTKATVADKMHRPSFARSAASCAVSFAPTPNLDEGCLGGF